MVTWMFAYPVIARGHYRALSWVLVPLLGALSFALPEGIRTLGVVVSILAAITLLSVYSRRPLLEWLAGASAAAAAAVLIYRAGLLSCSPVCPSGGWIALVGAFSLGAITHAMVLGHWYLNQARLPIDPLQGSVLLTLASCLLWVVVGLIDRSELLVGTVPGGVLNFSSSSVWWTWIVMAISTAVLVWMARVTIRTRSTQSATGLLYLAIVPALAAQFALTLLIAT